MTPLVLMRNPRGRPVRGLENLVAAIMVISMIVSLATAASILVSRAVYSGIHVISSRALTAIPPSMELKPLSGTCSNGFLSAELRVSGTGSAVTLTAVVYDLRGRVIGAYRGVNGSVIIRIPCNEDVVVTLNTSSGGFWVYRYGLDPGMRCLRGYIVNASALLRGCPRSVGGINVSGYPAMLQPLWIRGVLVSGNALSLLDRYGPVPGLVIDTSETTYTVLGRSNNYLYRFIPGSVRASATLYDSNLTVRVTYPVFCKPGLGCLYRSYSYYTSLPEKVTNADMHLEYEYASLSIGRPGWIHIRDYRVILPLNIQLYGDPAGEYSGWGFRYTWWVEANLSPPFFYARIMERMTRLSDGATFTVCTKKSISSLYSRAIDMLVIPLLVSRDSGPIVLSFGVLPVQYSAQGQLVWRFWTPLLAPYTEKKYGPYQSGPQYVAIYAYLIPVSEWRPGIPVDLQELQAAEPSQATRAVYRVTLLNLTRLEADKALGGVVSINVSDIFGKAGLLDNYAVLAVELVLASKYSRLILDTTNNTDDMGQSLFCNTGVALIGGIDDYVHLSILPAKAYTGQDSLLLLLPGEGVEGNWLAYNVSELELPRSTSSSIEFHEPHSNGEYVEGFTATALPVRCEGCKVLSPPPGSIEVNSSKAIHTIGVIQARLEECVSAETILEKMNRMGQNALIVK